MSFVYPAKVIIYQDNSDVSGFDYLSLHKINENRFRNSLELKLILVYLDNGFNHLGKTDIPKFYLGAFR